MSKCLKRKANIFLSITDQNKGSVSFCVCDYFLCLYQCLCLSVCTCVCVAKGKQKLFVIAIRLGEAVLVLVQFSILSFAVLVMSIIARCRQTHLPLKLKTQPRFCPVSFSLSKHESGTDILNRYSAENFVLGTLTEGDG